MYTFVIIYIYEIFFDEAGGGAWGKIQSIVDPQFVTKKMVALLMNLVNIHLNTQFKSPLL